MCKDIEKNENNNEATGTYERNMLRSNFEMFMHGIEKKSSELYEAHKRKIKKVNNDVIN